MHQRRNYEQAVDLLLVHLQEQEVDEVVEPVEAQAGDEHGRELLALARVLDDDQLGQDGQGLEDERARVAELLHVGEEVEEDVVGGVLQEEGERARDKEEDGEGEGVELLGVRVFSPAVELGDEVDLEADVDGLEDGVVDEEQDAPALADLGQEGPGGRQEIEISEDVNKEEEDLGLEGEAAEAVGGGDFADEGESAGDGEEVADESEDLQIVFVHGGVKKRTGN